MRIGIAQLKRDVGALERLARISEASHIAVDALERIGAWEALGRLASDPSYVHRARARRALTVRP
jgi:hypothetical protein